MRFPWDAAKPLRVEVSLASPSAAPAWQDVSAAVKGSGVRIQRGAGHWREPAREGMCSLAFDNTDGAFSEVVATPGGPAARTLYRKPLRVAYRHPMPGNMVDAESATFEGGTVGNWTGSSGATVDPSTVRAASGARSMLVTWPSVSANGASASWTRPPVLVIGRRYTAYAKVWVPAGSPPVRLAFVSQVFPYYGSASTVTGDWQRISTTFTAPATELFLVVRPASAATAGQQVWVDEVLIDEADLPPEVVFRRNFATNPRLVGALTEWGGALEYIEPQFSRAVLPDAPASTTGAILGSGDPTGTFTRTIDGGQP
ncbi:carbohydrate binding domain-containing protein [Phycicoccus avicenniae]|uniref:carbohydrate binding domain-containing protein n=1 Tax=Phycicoccus avicenniae TaxID=2828860 RepID=UPI003D2DBD30